MITVRSSQVKDPVLRLKMYNNWTAQRHRLLFKYSMLVDPSLPRPRRSFHMTALVPGATPLTVLQFEPAKAQWGAPAAGQSRPMYHSGGLGRVLRLDDDRIIGYSSDLRSYFDEPRRALLRQVRFDPWKKLAPKYSKEAPPPFTTEQRERLGGEIRALVKPHLKDVWRGFIRELPQSRTFNGITSEGIVGKGYRMTWLINGGGIRKQDAQWMRVTFEWWLAPEMPGDDTVREFRKAERESVKDIGLPTASLWLNEALPVLWHTLPEEIHQAVATLLPPASSPRAGLGGTPIYMAMTMKLPPAQGAEFGDLRIESMLQKRHTNDLAEKVFSEPDGYEKVPLQPKIKQYNDMINQQLVMRDTAAEEGVDSLGFTWEAMRAYAAATNDALPAGMRPPSLR
jgi:hypothetical protein